MSAQAEATGASGTGAASIEEQGRGVRFELRLPPGVVKDLDLMQERTGQTFAFYIRQAILRAIKEDKADWTGI